MGQLNFTTEELNNLLEDLNDKTSINAYLSASATTTMTNSMDWYPIQGTFVNEFQNFVLDVDKVKYIGTRNYILEIDWNAKLASNTVSATINITISINGTPLEEQKMGTFLKTAGEPQHASGTAVVEIQPDDTIQLVMQTDKAGSIITVGNFVTTANKFIQTRA